MNGVRVGVVVFVIKGPPNGNTFLILVFSNINLACELLFSVISTAFFCQFIWLLFSIQLLVPLVSSLRYEGDEVNNLLAKSEAKILRDKIEEKAYADDDFIRIVTTRSKAQLNATLNHYNNSYGNSINKVQTQL